MIDTRSTNGESHDSKLVVIVKNLVASKVQYIEHELDFLHHSFDDISKINAEILENDHPPAKLRSLKMRLDNFIEQIEKLSYSRDLLLLIQTLIREETANAVYELLSNDKYLFYSANMLQRLLNLEVYIAEQFFSSSEN